MPHFAISAVGADRPGIVAGVTGALVHAGCNLEDTTMTILRGHFAMMLVVSAPEGASVDSLEGALSPVGHELDLVLAVREIDDSVPTSPPGDEYVVSVYGADRPGIVHRVTSLLADRHVNVIDVSTRVIGDPDRPVYAMVLEVTIPPQVDPSALGDELDTLAAELGVDCSLHPDEADIL